MERSAGEWCAHGFRAAAHCVWLRVAATALAAVPRERLINRHGPWWLRRPRPSRHVHACVQGVMLAVARATRSSCWR
eukprot:293953-Chlamydomonas_euryale.AAC.2